MDAAKFRTHQGIAYGCFLIIAITALVGGIGALLPNLGGVFFLLVIPLMIASFFAIIIGAAETLFIVRQDSTLLRILCATVVVLALLIFDVPDQGFDVPVQGWARNYAILINVISLLYGVVVSIICFRWLSQPPLVYFKAERGTDI